MQLVGLAGSLYKSPDYNTAPLKTNTKGISTRNASHPLHGNWLGMLTRTTGGHNNPSNTHYNVQVEPAWNGLYLPGSSNTKDKFAFMTYTLFMDTFLGTKPNFKHTSSAEFHVDRSNNMLHYSTDNVRFASAALNYHNKSLNYSANPNSTILHSESTKSTRFIGNVVRRSLARYHKHIIRAKLLTTS